MIVGPNGAGKTNLLEAIGYLATLRSLRGVGDDAVVRAGETAAVVRGEAERGDSSALIELEISARGRNRVLVNKRRPNRVSDLLGEVRAVTFLPDDLDLVKRGPAHRRQLLDEVAVQLAPAAALDQLEYDRALRQRNSLLRQAQGRDPDPTTLAVWDARMSQAGAKVVLRRRAAMAAMTAHVVGTYEKLAGERTEIEMSYQTAWGDGGDETSLAQALEAALEGSRRADRERRTTTVGPHRDEPSLLIGHRSASHPGQPGRATHPRPVIEAGCLLGRGRCHRRAASACSWTMSSPSSIWAAPAPSEQRSLPPKYSSRRPETTRSR